MLNFDQDPRYSMQEERTVISGVKGAYFYLETNICLHFLISYSVPLLLFLPQRKYTNLQVQQASSVLIKPYATCFRIPRKGLEPGSAWFNLAGWSGQRIARKNSRQSPTSFPGSSPTHYSAFSLSLSLSPRKPSRRGPWERGWTITASYFPLHLTGKFYFTARCLPRDFMLLFQHHFIQGVSSKYWINIMATVKGHRETEYSTR